MIIFRLFVQVIGIFVVVFCLPLSAETIAGKFTAADGKMLLFIGQDSDTIKEYTEAIQEHNITGITLYTEIVSNDLSTSLRAISGPVEYGAGTTYFEKTLADLPDAALAVGLYLSDSPHCKSRHLTNIYKGRYDNVITRLAQYLRDLKPRLVFLRIGYEFDGPWNCYSHKPYKKAFRYIRQTLDEHGASNVATVWQTAAWPTAVHDGQYGRYYDHSRKNHLQRWYPGDDVVDWIGISVFHRDQSRWKFKPPQDIRLVQEKVLDFARQRQKPVMIAEAAPQGFSTEKLTVSSIHDNRPQPVKAETIWNSWFHPFFSFVNDNRDVIRAVAYINTHWQQQPMWSCKLGADGGPPDCENGNWGDSRVHANSYIKSKWLEEILNEDRWFHQNSNK